MHTSRLNRPKAPPETETPPENMLCNECNAGGVSESIQGYKDMSTTSHKHVCIHKQDLHLAQQGISNQSRARQVQFRRNKSITLDLALASRE